jgi:NADPH:quinone reductase-like Zn-dependent oxidoreductase
LGCPALPERKASRTMKAARLHGWGEPLQIEDVAMPVPEEDEVLVKVHAVSLNPLDAVIIAGYVQNMISVPLTPGTDVSGEVAAVGSKVTSVKPGDPVYGMIAFGPGTLSEYTIAKEGQVSAKPQSLDYVNAAAMPLSSLAAWSGVHDLAQVKAGDRVLILGAGGNVGTLATKMAKSAGAYVIGVNRAGKEEHIRSAGADEVLDMENFETGLEPVDVVLNYADDSLAGRALSVIKPGGIYITALFYVPAEEAAAQGVRAAQVWSQASSARLESIAALADSGTLALTTLRTFPLEEVQDAFAYRMTNRSPGKVVVTLA